MSPAEGNYLKYEINKFKNISTTAGAGSFMTGITSRYMGGFVGGIAGALYTYTFTDITNEIEYRLSKNKSMWLKGH